MTVPRLEIVPGEAALSDLERIARGKAALSLPPDSMDAIATSAEAIRTILADGRAVYGINTGFGLLADRRIEPKSLAALQRNLVLSHCCGVGASFEDEVVRLIVALKALSLARGYSGVRPATVDALLALLDADALPVIPSQGSVGASGDLAPLAHLAAALMGVGEIRYGGGTFPASDALVQIGLTPLAPGPKEGLALLNGTQASTALALMALFRGRRVFDAALIAGAMSLDAMKGSDTPFDPRIHAVRGHKGQILVAQRLSDLLKGSEIRDSHRQCTRVQDPYSLRCQPQVMGAVFDVFEMAGETLRIEANAVTDNPLIFADSGEALSGGNFHAEPVAFAADMLANALIEIASLSERRLALLLDPKWSGLPPFLARESGLHSGLMIAQVTAAALLAECRMIAHPASVDSIPTSANQEDHVSMATHGAARTLKIADMVAQIVGIELMAAAEGISHHAPFRTSEALETAHRIIRHAIAPLDEDRYLAPDLAAAKDLVLGDALRPVPPSSGSASGR
ncbi:MAG: histidine ammonia-lyase [Rhodothalassiaceae bacterium]